MPRSESERLRREQNEAQEHVEAILRQTRPKNFREGFFRGVNDIIAGALGAIGVAILAPAAGFAVGREAGGCCGGLFGLVCGTCLGLCGACLVVTHGCCDGFSMIIRGCCAIPASLTEPRKGKWWAENEGEWVVTNLETEAQKMAEIPEDDMDILGQVKEDSKPDGLPDGSDVVDPYYYDVLDVTTAADNHTIKKHYYTMARKYHPDKAGKDNKEAADKFKEISEAYQVLSDPDLRKKYDSDGREALSADRTETSGPQIDPKMLFAFLFGSDMFNHYIGTTATATAASIGGSPNVGIMQARMLQKRRCTRLALLLCERLQIAVSGDNEKAISTWLEEGDRLVQASYGYPLLHLIGSVYSLAAVQFLGSLDSGIGMPSISEWAKSHAADWKRSADTKSKQKDTLFAGLSMLQMQLKYQQARSNAKNEEEQRKIDVEFQREMSISVLNVMWTTTVIDITSTLHETCQMVLFDVSIDADVRRKRGESLKLLGNTLSNIPPPESNPDDSTTEKLYEEAAFAAMLETIKRKDDAADRKSVV